MKKLATPVFEIDGIAGERDEIDTLVVEKIERLVSFTRHQVAEMKVREVTDPQSVELDDQRVRRSDANGPRSRRPDEPLEEPTAEQLVGPAGEEGCDAGVPA